MIDPECVLPPEDISNAAIAARLTDEARRRIATGEVQKKRLVWLELTGCSGNIISLMDGFHPDLEYMLTSMVDLVYSNSLMVAEGEQAMERLMSLEGEFILAVEGAVALRENGLYHVIGRWQGEPVTALAAATMLGNKATHVIAVG
ncbi:MAG TPA: Ni/Fe hydrogenase, partial [Symbiobacteriaceae bacterium]|nr:Ni/Fe hydrogenase [Symbiobacteriaceae bacterium]